MLMNYLYRQVNSQFYQELTDCILNEESAILLGPNFAGKRHILDEVKKRLENISNNIIYLKFKYDEKITTSRNLSDFIIKKIKVKLSDKIQHSNDFFHPIDQLFKHQEINAPIILLVDNIDRLPHYLARSFLEGIRLRVEDGKLVTLLSGESDLQELIYGPNSVFNCAYQYVIRGFDFSAFKAFIERHIPALVSDDHKVYDFLWKQSQGHVFVLRMISTAVTEHQIRFFTSSSMIDVSFIKDALKKFMQGELYKVYCNRFFTAQLSCEENAWETLISLISKRTVTVKYEDSTPTSLELSGIALRVGGIFQFSCPLIKKVITKYFNYQRLGDIYARKGDWEKAHALYGLCLNEEENIRPVDVNDWAETEKTLNALGLKLHSAASKGIAEVTKLFSQICQSVLGFTEVTFWQANKHNQEWKPEPLSHTAIDDNTITEIKTMLSRSKMNTDRVDLKNDSDNQISLPSPWDRYTLAVSLPALHKENIRAVVVGDFKRKVVISTGRKHLTERLLDQFVAAYTHAIEVKRNEERVKIRDEQMDIISNIMDALGSQITNVGHTLEAAGEGLVKLGYSRVLFCLVDPEEEKIQCVFGNPKGKFKRCLFHLANYRLDEHEKDIQPYVIYHRKSRIVPDPITESLANNKVVKALTIKAFAVFPMLNSSGMAIGTIHIEREDGAVPSKEEVEDLEVFGKMLAIAIEQSNRINFQHSALDKIPAPVLILDSLKRARYANEPASKLFGTPRGWISSDQAVEFPLKKLGKLNGHVQNVRNTPKRTVQHIRGIGDNPDSQDEVLFDGIKNWLDRNVGVLIHVRDLDYLYRIFDAFRKVAEATDIDKALLAMLDATKILNHKWGRLYLIDEKNPDLLVSKFSFGIKDKELERIFNAGEYQLPERETKGTPRWLSIEEGKPMIFCRIKDKPDGAHIPISNSHGLYARNVHNSFHQRSVFRGKGPFWIDFPLLTTKNELGKLTLECDQNLRQEDFELLKVLFKMIEGLMDAFIRRDQEYKKREAWIQNAAEKSTATTAHNIASQFSTLDIYCSQYREFENRCAGLKTINDRLEKYYNSMLQIMEHTKKMLSPISVDPSLFDILEKANETFLDIFLERRQFSIECNAGFLEMKGDEKSLGTALIELIKNSQDAIEDKSLLEIEFSITTCQRTEREFVRFIYKDNGPGIPEEFKARIFDTYFSRKPNSETSTGFGLSHVKRVVQAHQGHIYEDGKYGEGARFVIEMPRYYEKTVIKSGISYDEYFNI